MISWVLPGLTVPESFLPLLKAGLKVQFGGSDGGVESLLEMRVG